jgi:hypothetical protein
MKSPKSLEEAFLFHEEHKNAVPDIILLAEATLEKLEEEFSIQPQEPPADEIIEAEVLMQEAKEEGGPIRPPFQKQDGTCGEGNDVIQWIANILAFNLERLKRHGKVLAQEQSSDGAICQGLSKTIKEEQAEKEEMKTLILTFTQTKSAEERAKAENRLHVLIEKDEKRAKIMNFFAEELEERGANLFPSLCWFHVSLKMTCELATCAQELLQLQKQKKNVGKATLQKMVGRIMDLVGSA